MPVDPATATMALPTLPERHHQAFDSTPLAVRAALARLRTALSLPADDADRIEIAMAEVLNNIVEHAYAEAPGHVVELWATRQGTTISIDVQDTGRSLPERALPEGAAADLSGGVETIPEGGFGWFLIHTLASEITYTRKDGYNRLSVLFDLTP